MKATHTFLVAMALAAFVDARQVSGQCVGINNCSVTHTVSVTVAALVKLDVGTATTTLTSPTPANITSGAAVPDPGPTIAISANRSWTLNIRSQNPTNWTYAGGNGGVKPIGDLAWSIASGGTFAALTATDVIFTSGTTGALNAPAQAFFRTTWAGGFASPSNAPGTYTLPIVFTLTAP
jgi:hypothetical protein